MQLKKVGFFPFSCSRYEEEGVPSRSNEGVLEEMIEG